MEQIIHELQDMTYLSWAKARNSSGTAGSFLKAWEEGPDGKIYYKLGSEDYTLPQKVLQLTPPESRFIELTKEYLLSDPRTYICTAFIHDNKLYCIMRSPEGMYIASYRDGALHKEMDLGCNYHTKNWRGHLLRVNNHPDNQAFFQCEDVTTDNPVLLTVEGSKIHVWYLEIK